jgi:hypothetical protein
MHKNEEILEIILTKIGKKWYHYSRDTFNIIKIIRFEIYMAEKKRNFHIVEEVTERRKRNV